MGALAFVVARCRTKEGPDLKDILVGANGTILSIEPYFADRLAWPETVDAEGGLLLPGFVEPHIHLDKALLLSRMPAEAKTLNDAIRMTGELKSGFTREDIRDRSLAALKMCAAHGVTHMRCHVEIDPILGLTSLESTLALRESVRSWIDLQIVAFPQEGIFRSPGTASLLEEAMRHEVDAVGGIPYNDRDAEEHLAYVFALAERFGKPLDFHIDFSDDPNLCDLERVAALALERGMAGRVAAGHATSIGSMETERAKAVADMLAKAGIAVMALPATDLYMGGRGDEKAARRGLTPVSLLLDAGVNVVFGTNNIRNPFTPFGTGDPLDIAWLLAQTAYLGGEADAGLLLDMATNRSARAIGLAGYGLRARAPADLVLLPVATAREALLGRPPRLRVWKNGKPTVENRLRTEWHIAL